MVGADIIRQFAIPGKLIGQQKIEVGHINNTFKAVLRQEDGTETAYIFQAVNTHVFKHPEDLANNTYKVTEHLRQKLISRNIDPTRRVIQYATTVDGAYFYVDQENRYWRAYRFIDNASSYDVVTDPEVVTNAARAFGRFQRDLEDFPIGELIETIPDFHDTRKRFSRFEQVAKDDPKHRLDSCRDTVEKVLARKRFASYFMEMIDRGEIPIRVTHNDTKVNNVLVDNATNEGLCVIDLDTVMPGLSVYDFGDAIRFAANTAVEDEPDLSKVHLDMQVYDAFSKGFIGEIKETLTPVEVKNMHFGAMMMTFEVGMRFLTDYLEGDVYFKTHYPEHNLVRARCQMALFEEMWERQDEMLRDVLKYAEA